MVGIASVPFAGDDDGAVVHETRDVVDVPVGVVALDARPQPEDLVHAQEGLDALLDLLPREPGIAVGVEKDGLGREDLSEAVLLDRSALENHARLEARQAEGLRDADGNLVVLLVGSELVPPSVEPPVRHREISGSTVFDEERTVVAAPDIVVGMVEEFDPFADRPGGEDLAPDRVVPRGRSVDADGFVPTDGRGDLREDRLHPGQGFGPAVGMAGGPGKPDGGLWFPLGGHAVAEGFGGFGDGRNEPGHGTFSPYSQASSPARSICGA